MRVGSGATRRARPGDGAVKSACACCLLVGVVRRAKTKCAKRWDFSAVLEEPHTPGLGVPCRSLTSAKSSNIQVSIQVIKVYHSSERFILGLFNARNFAHVEVGSLAPFVLISTHPGSCNYSYIRNIHFTKPCGIYGRLTNRFMRREMLFIFISQYSRFTGIKCIILWSLRQLKLV